MSNCPVCHGPLTRPEPPYAGGAPGRGATGGHADPPEYCPAPGCGAALRRPRQDIAATAVRVTVLSAGIAVGPGQTGRVRVRLHNAGERADEYRLEVTGLPDGWAVTGPAVLPLRPAESGHLTVSCAIPRAATFPPRELRVGVRAVSLGDPAVCAVGSFGVRVRALIAPTPAPARPNVHGRRRVRLAVVVRNDGNVPAPVRLRAYDPSARVMATCTPRSLELAPGQVGAFDVRMMFWRRLLIGRPRRSTVWFVAESGTVSRRVPVACEQRSLLPRWLYIVLRIAAREAIAMQLATTAAAPGTDLPPGGGPPYAPGAPPGPGHAVGGRPGAGTDHPGLTDPRNLAGLAPPMDGGRGQAGAGP